MLARKLLLVIPFIFAAIRGESQGHTTFNGLVTDSRTGERLVGASIRILGTTIGTQSDTSGQFTVQVPNKSFSDSLIVTYVGYDRFAELISRLENRGRIHVDLVSQATTLKEVIVHSDFWRKQYSPEQLKEDYTKFYTIMEKVHTGLFDYMTEGEWQALKDSSFHLEGSGNLSHLPNREVVSLTKGLSG